MLTAKQEAKFELKMTMRKTARERVVMVDISENGDLDLTRAGLTSRRLDNDHCDAATFTGVVRSFVARKFGGNPGSMSGYPPQIRAQRFGGRNLTGELPARRVNDRLSVEAGNSSPRTLDGERRVVLRQTSAPCPGQAGEVRRNPLVS